MRRELLPPGPDSVTCRFARDPGSVEGSEREELIMPTRTFVVDGMSCGHCVQSVTGEVTKVPGVAGVTVDLSENTVAVSGEDVDEAAVRAAIGEAGYAVVG